MVLRFNFCNESIPSIIAGLNPNENDIILAIGGSGDQAFALLEFGCKVCVVDYNPAQINYIKEVIQNIKQNNFNFFINIENNDNVSKKIKQNTNIDFFELRTKYFNNLERFEKIRSNIDKLILIEPAQSIFEFVKNTNLNFSKIYLSNIYTTMSNYSRNGDKGHFDFSEFSNSLEIICSKLFSNGIIYFADGDVIRERLKNIRFNSLFNISEKFSLKNNNLKVDKNRTKSARKKQSFKSRTPLILKKIN